MQTKTYISHFAFSGLSLLSFIGILCFLYPSMLIFYLIGILLAAILLIKDRTRLPPADAFSTEVLTAKQVQITKPIELEVRVHSYHPNHSFTDKLLIHPPTSERIIWKRNETYSHLENIDGYPVFRTTLIGNPLKLGYEEVKNISWTIRSPLRLWVRTYHDNECQNSFRIMPDVRPIPDQVLSQMMKNSRMLSQSRKVLLRSNIEDQFRSLREFRYPDSIRRIDPKKSAKYQRLMTKIYDSYHSHHLIMVLDVGRTMAGTIAGSRKHDYYLSVALSLVQSALNAGDKVSFFAMADRVQWSTTGANRMNDFQPLFRADKELDCQDTLTSFDRIPQHLQSIETKRSIVILFTDLTSAGAQQALLRTVPQIAKTHLVLLLSLEDEDYSLDLQVLESSKEKVDFRLMKKFLYLYWLENRYNHFTNQISHHGASALKIPEPFWVSGCVKAYELMRMSLAA